MKKKQMCSNSGRRQAMNRIDAIAIMAAGDAEVAAVFQRSSSNVHSVEQGIAQFPDRSRQESSQLFPGGLGRNLQRFRGVLAGSMHRRLKWPADCMRFPK
jgi:hypothetical protein